MLANGYSYFNAYPIHDAVNHFITNNSGTYQLRLGRYLMPIYIHIRGDLSMPWVTGVLCMAYMGGCVFIITFILGQATKLEIALTAGFLSANLFTLEINAIHQYYADAFVFSLLLACLGVYCICQKRTVKNWIAALFCLYLSFGLYPAFCVTAMCLIALLFVRELLAEGGMTKKIFFGALLRIAAVAAAGVMYLITNKLLYKILGLEPSSDNWSIFSAGNRSIDYLVDSVLKNYGEFGRIYFDLQAKSGWAASVAAILLAAIFVPLFIKLCLKKTNVGYTILLIVLLAVFPMASRIVNIFTGTNKAYRTLFAQFLFLPILVWLIIRGANTLKDKNRGRIVCAVALLSAIILCSNIRYNNGGFTAQRILNDRAVYYTGRVIEDMQEFGVKKNERVAIIGVFKTDGPKDKLLAQYTGIGGFSTNTGVTYTKVLHAMAANLGYSMNFKTNYPNAVKNLPEVKAMPSFPEKGYIAKVNGYIVVKLS